MAQLAEADIYLGSSRIVGRVMVDAGRIRSEAGPLEPRLVAPLRIEMANRPEDQMLVVTDVVARLHLGNENDPASQVGLPARTELVPGFHARSLPDGSSRHDVDLRFQLTPAAVHRVEAARHTNPSDPFELKIVTDCRVAWMRETWGQARATSHGRAGSVLDEDPFQMQFGLHSSLSWFWTVQLNALRVQVEQSAWIANVLPGLGLDSHRLIEVWLPPTLPGSGVAVRAWDEAVRAYNARNYAGCISKCRAIVTAWNRKGQSTKSRPMGQAVAEANGWADDDARIAWINSMWQAVVNIGNETHHPETRSNEQEIGAPEARMHLMAIAALSEYLHGRIA